MIFEDVATACLKRGFGVFPLKPGSKIPFSGSNGLKDATHDPERVADWARLCPTANVGIATGAESGVAVVDIDVKDGKGGVDSIREMEEKHGTLPKAPLVRTPSGGWHCYFRNQDGLGSKNGLLPGVDFKADGGYVLAPGCVIDGAERPYEWLRAPLGPAWPALPIWVRLALKPPAPPPHYRGRESDGDTAAKTRAAMRYVTPPANRDEWRNMIFAIHDGLGPSGLDEAESWSAQGVKYKPREIWAFGWNKVKRGAGVTVGTLFAEAYRNGWNGKADG